MEKEGNILIEPRFSMTTLRRFLIFPYDITSIISKILSSKIVGVISYFIIAIPSFLMIFLYHYFKISLSSSQFFLSSIRVEHILPKEGFSILNDYAPFLLIELPFGKLTHLIYRPFTIYFYKVKEISYKRG